MDTAALKKTWALAETLGDEVPLYFYSHLFLSHPGLRSMFPVSMATQRDRLVGALGRIVSNVDQLDEVTAFIQQLGRDHRRFEVIAEHYDAVGASLLATLEHFLGDLWTEELAGDWAAAYGVIAGVMVQAAAESEQTSPASWSGQVVDVDRRGLDIVVVQVRPEPHLPFEPGQSVAVEVPARPRLWRYLSPANAPRPDGSLEFHVQLVPGGQVSSTIVRDLRPGERVRIGAAVGQELTLDERERERDLVMVAGGTGLAPLRAHLERLDQVWRSTGRAPRVDLFHGARVPSSLYEHRLLQDLSGRPWFTYTPVISDDPTYPGAKGYVGDAAADAGPWHGRLALVCGSAEMVRHTVRRLRAAGVAHDDVRFEQFATLDEDSHALHHHTHDPQPTELPQSEQGAYA
ncbi:globin domain-containing protein [Agromyces aurantiacus]|uniref:nitric oxide dioxygenase n=1 Tax=Agromyces aurantiacus TaxID=165814 RepID=A0ABV9R1Z0_9MICO|nr:globin domain-containing protein [Agromyces aurantiacus]MBM7502802.1 NAD(P)H-flavin reductase [Agromyces aurantiacus]